MPESKTNLASKRPYAIRRGCESIDMRCERCDGCVVETKAYDEEAAIWLWRCLNCGDRFDDTIRFRRSLP